MKRLVMHLTTIGTPHRVRCGVNGEKAYGSWPSSVPGELAQPPAMAKWLRDDGWRWCSRCVVLDKMDNRRAHKIGKQSACASSSEASNE